MPARALLAPDLPLLEHKLKPKTGQAQKYVIATIGLIHDVNPSHLADLREALLDARARPSSASRYNDWVD